jgi:hypothetical protein
MSETIGANFSASLSIGAFQPSFASNFSADSFDSGGFAQSSFAQGGFTPTSFGGFNQQAPISNQANALGYIQAASEATDPGMQSQLLQDALQQLTPGGSSASGVGAQGQGGGMQQEIQQMQQEIQQLGQQIQQLEGGSSGTAPAPASYGGASPSGDAGGAADPSAAGTGDGSSGVGDPSSAGQNGSSNLSVNGNSVNTGMYTISGGSKDDGSLTITNNQTGQSTEVWGDPHVKVNGQDVADFQKGNLNIQLQDGTTVHIQPGALQNGVAHIDQVSITNANGQAVTMGGNDGTFQDGVTTSGVQQNGAGVQDGLMDAPNTTNTTLGADGELHYNNANGSEGAIIGQTNGGETDLDGAGGGLAGQPASSGSTSGASEQQLMNQLMMAVEQHSSGMNQQLMSMVLQNMEHAMQSNMKANIAA